MSEVTPTAEQIAANEARARAESESLRFLQSHLEYAGDPADNKKLADYLQKDGLDWTAANLELAYQALCDELKHKSQQEISVRAKKLCEQLSNPQPEFPWKTPLTKQVLNRMRPEDLKQFMKDKRFLEQLDSISRR